MDKIIGNNLTEISNNIVMENYKKTDDIYADMQTIIDTTQKAAHSAVNVYLVQRNWLIGYRIAEEEFGSSGRTENYGLNIIKKLSERLTKDYGKGFTKTNLYSFYSFYKAFPNIFHSACGKSLPLLSWSHYRTLVQVHDVTAREWYTKEATEQTWSVKTLQRNISSQYYYRLLKSQNKEPVENEMKELTAEYQADKLEFIKNPVIAEFLGLGQNTGFTETELETSIISNIQKFLMEMGKGYAFVASDVL